MIFQGNQLSKQKEFCLGTPSVFLYKKEILIAIVHKEINKIVQGDIKQEDLDKTLTNYLKVRKQQKDSNNYDMDLLVTFYRDEYNKDQADSFENIINTISKKDLQEFTQKLLNNAKMSEIVFKPKE